MRNEPEETEWRDATERYWTQRYNDRKKLKPAIVRQRKETYNTVFVLFVAAALLTAVAYIGALGIETWMTK